MAKKKRESFVQRLGETVSDMADAVSVAATGSQLGLLEIAAEEELGLTKPRRRKKPAAVKRKMKRPASKKRVSKKTASKAATGKRVAKRRPRQRA